jgi:hypothetical protein
MIVADQHPSEMILNEFMEQIKNTIDMYKSADIDIKEKSLLRSQMEGFVKKLRYLQRQRYREYINADGSVNDMPRSEEQLLREMTHLIVTMDMLISE